MKESQGIVKLDFSCFTLTVYGKIRFILFYHGVKYGH